MKIKNERNFTIFDAKTAKKWVQFYGFSCKKTAELNRKLMVFPLKNSKIGTKIHGFFSEKP